MNIPKTNGSKDLMVKSACLVAMLETLTNYQMTRKGTHQVELSVKVLNNERTFTANNLYDLPKQLGDWLVTLPKDVWNSL